MDMSCHIYSLIDRLRAVVHSQESVTSLLHTSLRENAFLLSNYQACVSMLPHHIFTTPLHQYDATSGTVHTTSHDCSPSSLSSNAKPETTVLSAQKRSFRPRAFRKSATFTFGSSRSSAPSPSSDFPASHPLRHRLTAAPPTKRLPCQLASSLLDVYPSGSFPPPLSSPFLRTISSSSALPVYLSPPSTTSSLHPAVLPLRQLQDTPLSTPTPRPPTAFRKNRLKTVATTIAQLVGLHQRLASLGASDQRGRRKAGESEESQTERRKRESAALEHKRRKEERARIRRERDEQRKKAEEHKTKREEDKTLRKKKEEERRMRLAAMTKEEKRQLREELLKKKKEREEKKQQKELPTVAPSSSHPEEGPSNAPSPITLSDAGVSSALSAQPAPRSAPHYLSSDSTIELSFSISHELLHSYPSLTQFAAPEPSDLPSPEEGSGTHTLTDPLPPVTDTPDPIIHDLVPEEGAMKEQKEVTEEEKKKIKALLLKRKEEEQQKAEAAAGKEGKGDARVASAPNYGTDTLQTESLPRLPKKLDKETLKHLDKQQLRILKAKLEAKKQESLRQKGARQEKEKEKDKDKDKDNEEPYGSAGGMEEQPQQEEDQVEPGEDATLLAEKRKKQEDTLRLLQAKILSKLREKAEGAADRTHPVDEETLQAISREKAIKYLKKLKHQKEQKEKPQHSSDEQ